jgi:phage-related protein
MQQTCQNIQNFVYSSMVDLKPVEFRGTALEDLRAFPTSARREAGHQIDQVQHGQEPDDWKPMPTIGKGAREIRVRDVTGAFRVIYVTKFGDIVYVLTVSRKKRRRPANRTWS